MATSCSVLENELWHQTNRVTNINSINEQLQDFMDQAKQQQKHQKQFLHTLEMNKADQKEIIENVEVGMYEKTKEKAEIDIQTEGLIDFINIFAKKLKETQSDQSRQTWAGFASYALGMS